MRYGLLFSMLLAVGLLLAACRQQVPGEGAPAKADSLAVQPADSVASAPEALPVALSYSARNGRMTYDKYCAVCHGTEGRGDGFNAYNLRPHPKDFTLPGYLAQVKDRWLLEIIAQGGRGAKRSVLMPAYENTLTSNEMQDVVAYVRHLAGSGRQGR